MAQCLECGFDWDADPDELIAEIRTFGAAYRACLTHFLEGEDGERLVRTRPAPEVWSALEYTAHMRDVTAFYSERIDRVLTEDRPTMPAADFAAMAVRLHYAGERIQSVLKALDRAATAAASRLDAIADEEWARVGIGSEGGERTVIMLARRLAHDGHHHLLDVGRVLRQVRHRG